MDYSTTDCNQGALPNQVKAFDSLPLKYDSTSQMYGYQTGSPSIFVRKITMKMNGTEITVTSIVSWKIGISTESVNLEDHFYNWADNY
jgi:hypothetical protein